jgi:membrane associated rhomboid family serine protease
MVINKLKLVLTICGLLLAIHILNTVLGMGLNQFGIRPRQLNSLWEIYTAPFLHGNFYHLANNLVGLSIFSSLYLVHSQRRYLRSSFIIITITGLLVWLFGRDAVHIGASGWVFGLWSLCIATAWFERRFINILIALFVVLFYGGVIYGVLPTDPRISFESHLFGVVAGFVCAYLNAKVLRKI